MNEFTIEELRKAYAFHRNGSNKTLELFNFYVGSDMPTNLKQVLSGMAQTLCEWHTRQMAIVEIAIYEATDKVQDVGGTK